MILDYRVIVNGDGIGRQPGVHFGGKKQQPRLVRRLSEFALFHLPGGSFWDGAHHTHHPTRYELVRLSDVEAGEGVAFTAKVVGLIESRKPGKKWQLAKREMLARLVGLVAK